MLFLSSSSYKNVPLYSARQEDSRAEEEDENIPAAGRVHVVDEKDESDYDKAWRRRRQEGLAAMATRRPGFNNGKKG